MIRLPLLIILRRLQWLPPLFVIAVILTLLYASSGPALSNYVITAIPMAAIGVWFTVIAGNCDDDSHRELIAARFGSVARAHAGRSVCAAIGVIVLSVVCTFLPALIGLLRYRSPLDTHPLPSSGAILAGGLAVHLASGFLGVGCGSFLHRPLLRRSAIAVLVAVLLSTLLAVLPPFLAVWRRLNRHDPSTTTGLFVGCAVFASLLVAISSRSAERR